MITRDRRGKDPALAGKWVTAGQSKMKTDHRPKTRRRERDSEADQVSDEERDAALAVVPGKASEEVSGKASEEVSVVVQSIILMTNKWKS